MNKVLAVIGAVLLVCACGNPGSGEADESADEEGVFDPMVGTMDRARGVEDVANSRLDELNKRVEEEE